MSHTPEPWSFNDREDIKGNGDTLPLLGISIPMTAGARQAEAKANARRIVACVNACRGIGTNTLERFVNDGAPEKGFGLHRQAAIESGRDTYRDLCVELYNALRLAKDMFVANDISLPHTFAVIDPAITKAEKILGDRNGQ